MPQQKPPVIVINSLVARGSVGGRASLFVLERLGFPVWFAPTVSLAWHPGHGPATRITPDPAAFRGLIGDLAKSPRLGEVAAILSGYIGDAGQAGMIAVLVQAVMRANPKALYLCDPIIGDAAGLFQPVPVAEAIRDRLLPLADIATPNRHELLWLTQMAADTNDSLVAAARKLGPDEVVVTSAFAGTGEIGNLSVRPEGTRLASHRLIPSVPHGTGDFLAALYLGARLDGAAPPAALERSVAATLRMVELAAELGTDELPLATGQDAIDAAPAGVRLTEL